MLPTPLTRSASPRPTAFSTPTLKDFPALLSDGATSAALRRRVVHRTRLASSALLALRSVSHVSSSDPLDRRNRGVVLYLTSLRVVRRIFEDCRTVRSILRGLRVVVEERDLFMDSGFLAELQTALGFRKASLPQVFLAGRCLGGADEIRRLQECGELKALMEGVPTVPAGVLLCERCNGVRFVVCAACSGSRKRHKGGKVRGFRCCGECNENGLVRCPDCFAPAVWAIMRTDQI